MCNVTTKLFYYAFVCVYHVYNIRYVYHVKPAHIIMEHFTYLSKFRALLNLHAPLYYIIYFCFIYFIVYYEVTLHTNSNEDKGYKWFVNRTTKEISLDTLSHVTSSSGEGDPKYNVAMISG